MFLHTSSYTKIDVAKWRFVPLTEFTRLSVNDFIQCSNQKENDCLIFSNVIHPYGNLTLDGCLNAYTCLKPKSKLNVMQSVMNQEFKISPLTRKILISSFN